MPSTRHAPLPSGEPESPTRKSFRSNRGRDTKPELRLRSAVHALGLRFRVDFAPLPGLRRRADLVFTRAKVAVFLDGCFWHGCELHYTAPRANAEFWAEKRRRNMERDLETNALLEKAGWMVLRFWEHDEIEPAALMIRRSVDDRRLVTESARSEPSNRRRVD